MREVQVLRQLRHPHIVEFLGAFADPRDPGSGMLCLLMAYCEGGDLQQRLQRTRQEGRRLREALALRWFDQLCSAVAYIHQHQILHRDLKPSNIFLANGRIVASSKGVTEEEESVAIGDFGVSRPLSHALELVTTMVGTPCYLSPEVCRGKPYSYKSDIWSLGCVLFEMMALRPPFGAAPNLEALVSRIVRADYSVPDAVACEFPEALRCVRALLRLDPERRPSAQALVGRPKSQQGAPGVPSLAQLAAESCGGHPGRPFNESPSGQLNAPSPAAAAAAVAAAVVAATTPQAPCNAAMTPFEPPPRGSSDGAGVGGSPNAAAVAAAAAAGAAISAAVSAALSPRTRGRAKLAGKILEAEAEQQHLDKVFSEVDPALAAAQRHCGYQPALAHAVAQAQGQAGQAGQAAQGQGPRGASRAQRRSASQCAEPSTRLRGASPPAANLCQPGNASGRGPSLPAGRRLANARDCPGENARRIRGRHRAQSERYEELLRGLSADAGPVAVCDRESSLEIGELRRQPGSGGSSAGARQALNSPRAGADRAGTDCAGPAAEAGAEAGPERQTGGSVEQPSPLASSPRDIIFDSPLQDSRAHRKRESRVPQQSQAFRDWLRRQRAERRDKLAPKGDDKKTEIYCPGFPVLASQDTPHVEGSPRTLRQLLPSGSEQSVFPSRSSSAAQLQPWQQPPGSGGSNGSGAGGASAGSSSGGGPLVGAPRGGGSTGAAPVPHCSAVSEATTAAELSGTDLNSMPGSTGSWQAPHSALCGGSLSPASGPGRGEATKMESPRFSEGRKLLATRSSTQDASSTPLMGMRGHAAVRAHSPQDSPGDAQGSDGLGENSFHAEAEVYAGDAAASALPELPPCRRSPVIRHSSPRSDRPAQVGVSGAALVARTASGGVVSVTEASSADDSQGNISIGDRIEGIRACLESRLGTQRFRKLYDALSTEGGSCAKSSLEAILASDQGLQDGSRSDDCDVGSLVPLVAKLVECENSYFS